MKNRQTDGCGSSLEQMKETTKICGRESYEECGGKYSIGTAVGFQALVSCICSGNAERRTAQHPTPHHSGSAVHRRTKPQLGVV